MEKVNGISCSRKIKLEQDWQGATGCPGSVAISRSAFAGGGKWKPENVGSGGRRSEGSRCLVVRRGEQWGG